MDWAGLLRVGLQGLGLRPSEFWALSPIELAMMLGEPTQAQVLSRADLEALAAAWPDQRPRATDGKG
ncbi:hypothetical protein BFP70_02400 [Thioclava sp. SK-1]|uniref:phage tail assembly chaperone n=1 Tax=Thioclava sp. SK-1 TaxID=1889770 RepID=UPI000825D08F|nr:phage tail assembly chaperone [Thioclava sp. SK-1]OCX67042.1 hypothetical protein BFP70_02400 [Thioclava sp. SK-1]